MTRTLTTALALLVAGCGQAKPFKAKRNLAYGDHTSQSLDYYEPPYSTGRSLRPTILAIHGGAWRSGDKAWGESVAEEFCPQGYVVVSINYRLSTEAQWPAQIEDCQAALTYVLEQDWMKVETTTVAAFGVSAGGHLASMLHLRGPTRVPFAISANGEGDLVNLRDQDHHLELLFGLEPGEIASAEQLADVSPTTFARPDANMLLIHSTGDPDVGFDHAVLLHQAVLQQGGDVSLLVEHSTGHGRVWREHTGNMVRWLRPRQGRARSAGSFDQLKLDTFDLPNDLEERF